MKHQEHYIQLGNRTASFWMVRVAAVVIVLHVFLTGPQFFTDTELVRHPGAQYAIWGLLCGLSLGALWQLRPQCKQPTMIRILVWLALAALVCQPAVFFESAYYAQWPDPFPALLHVSTVSFFVVRALLSAPATAAYSAIWSIAMLINMSILRDPQYAALLCAQFILVHWSCTLFVLLVRRCVRRTSLAIQQTADVSIADEQLAAKSRAHLRWDGIVHDKVIGALALAGRTGGQQVPVAVQQLAGDALHSLVGQDNETETFAQSIQATARRLGLTLHYDGQGSATPEQITEAMTTAVCEALTNVAKHAGVSDVWVKAEFSIHHALVTVKDLGRGFEYPATHGGSGLSLSIAAPLAGVGGSSSVRSSPGSGTNVTLKWRAHDAAVFDKTWPPTFFAPVVLMVNCSGLFAFGLGAQHWLSVLPVVHIGIALVLVGASLAVMFDSGHPWRCHIYAALVLVLFVVCAVIAPADTGAAWRHWYVTLTNPLAMVLPMLWSRFAGSAWVGAQLAALGCTKVALGESVMAFMNDAGTMSVGCLLIGLAMRIGLDRATARLAEGQHKKALFEAREAERQQLQRISDERRGAVLELTGEALRNLAEGGPLSRAAKRKLLQLESRARNLLLHGLWLPEMVSEVIGQARLDGASVTLLANDSVSWAGFDEVVVAALPLVGAADVVTISGPQAEDAQWSMVCEGPALAHVTGHLQQLREQHPTLEIYDDEDSCLVMLPITT